MKRMVLALFASLALFGAVKAGETEDIQFEQFFEVSKKNMPSNCIAVADKVNRIIFVTGHIEADYDSITPELNKLVKKQMVEEMRKFPADARIIKELKITSIYHFITSDKKVVTVPIYWHDL